MLSRHFRLDAAPGMTVAGNYNCAFYRDSDALEFFIIFGYSVIHINQRGSNVTVNGVSVVGWKLFGLLVGGGIDRYWRLLQLRHEFCWLNQFHNALLRSREEHVELLDFRIPPPSLHLLQDPLRVVLIVRRANMVRTRAQLLGLGIA